MLAIEVEDKRKNYIPLGALTSEQKSNFFGAKNCWICKKSFANSKNYKVRDHNHFTGKVDLHFLYKRIIIINLF